MIGINTKFGILYLEVSKQKGEARINVLDSNKKFILEYEIDKDNSCSTEPFMCALINRFVSMTSIDEFLKFSQIESYTTGNSWTDLLEDLYGLGNYELDEKSNRYYLLSNGYELTKESVLSDYSVNQIGTTYILNCT